MNYIFFIKYFKIKMFGYQLSKNMGFIINIELLKIMIRLILIIFMVFKVCMQVW